MGKLPVASVSTPELATRTRTCRTPPVDRTRVPVRTFLGAPLSSVPSQPLRDDIGTASIQYFKKKHSLSTLPPCSYSLQPVWSPKTRLTSCLAISSGALLLVRSLAQHCTPRALLPLPFPGRSHSTRN